MLRPGPIISNHSVYASKLKLIMSNINTAGVEYTLKVELGISLNGALGSVNSGAGRGGV